MTKLLQKEHLRKMQDARIELDRATTHMAQLEKLIVDAQAAHSEARSAADRARRVLEASRGERPRPMRSASRSSTSSSSSEHSEVSASRTVAT